MECKHFFDPSTNTLTYVVFDPKTRDAIVIDPVWDYDPQGSILSDSSFRQVRDFIDNNRLFLRLVLETHAHADHISGSQLFRKAFPECKTAIGERICLVQSAFKGVYNLPEAFQTDGSQFDILLKDHESPSFGSLKFTVIPTPGHTPACSSYLFGDMLFTGDAMFMPDYGTGRCDFPAGSAGTLYDSITQNIFTMPDSTRVFVGHDYMPGGRPLAFTTTVGEQKKKNIQLNQESSRDQFVRFRNDRDKTLTAPRLLYQSVLVNIDGGRLPPAEASGQRFLKMPLFGY